MWANNPIPASTAASGSTAAFSRMLSTSSLSVSIESGSPIIWQSTAVGDESREVVRRVETASVREGVEEFGDVVAGAGFELRDLPGGEHRREQLLEAGVLGWIQLQRRDADVAQTDVGWHRGVPRRELGGAAAHVLDVAVPGRDPEAAVRVGVRDRTRSSKVRERSVGVDRERLAVVVEVDAGRDLGHRPAPLPGVLPFPG